MKKRVRLLGDLAWLGLAESLRLWPTKILDVDAFSS